MEAETQLKTPLLSSSLNKISLQRQGIVNIIRKWGGTASEALLDPHTHFFSLPNQEGLIGYRLKSGCAVVLGDPVCSIHDRPFLIQAFHDYCKGERYSIVYLTASEEFTKWAMQNKVCQISIEFGEEFFMDPHSDPREKTGTYASLVRRKVRHAQNDGTEIHEYTSNNSDLEKSIEEVGIAWLKNRKGPQVYISQVRLFDDRTGKRWFYAQKGDKLVGVVVLNELKGQSGWLLNRLMITPDAPHGTPEFLVVTALDTLKNEGCHFVTFGSATMDELGKIQGLGPFSDWLFHHAFSLIHRFFHLSGHKKFWEKFDPENRKSYLLFSNKRIGIRDLLSLKSALNISFS